jgi:thioredoxin-dependent peroxiredoxin
MKTRLLCAVLVAACFAVGRPATALEIGKPAPDFTLPSASGENVSLKQFRGQKMVLLEFFGAAFAPT